MHTSLMHNLMSFGKCVCPRTLVNMCTRVTTCISFLVLLAVIKYHNWVAYRTEIYHLNSGD